MNGKCRFCGARVKLIDGRWQHDGIGTIVHIAKFKRKGATT